MHRLDVAVVVPNVATADGQGKVTLEVIRALVARRHLVTVYAHRLDADAKVRSQVRFHRLRRVAGPDLGSRLIAFAHASALLRRRRHDVTLLVGACALPRSPFVYHAHFSHAGWRSSWRRIRPSAYHRVDAAVGVALERVAVRRAARVVAVSRRVLRELPPTTVPCSIVPNGVEELAATGGERAGSRQALGVPVDDRTVVAFIGEFRTGRKNLDTLVEALGRTRRDLRLVVAGDGDRSLLERWAASAGVAPYVHPVGIVPSHIVLAAADVVVVPSRYEPFSLVALEAAAAGVPLVLSSVAGAVDVLAGACVELDDPEDPEALARAIEEALDGPARLERVVAARSIAASLSWPTVGERVAVEIEASAR